MTLMLIEQNVRKIVPCRESIKTRKFSGKVKIHRKKKQQKEFKKSEPIDLKVNLPVPKDTKIFFSLNSKTKKCIVSFGK